MFEITLVKAGTQDIIKSYQSPFIPAVNDLIGYDGKRMFEVKSRVFSAENTHSVVLLGLIENL